jgi:hypothetical protein
MGQRTSASFPEELRPKRECDADHSRTVVAICVSSLDVGNSPRMSDEGALEAAGRDQATHGGGDYEEALWGEAAGLIQAEVDADVYLEAQGLMVAEMADVTLAERIAAVESGQPLQVELAGGEVLRGLAVGGASDLCQLQVGSSRVIIPVHAVSVVSPLPRVLHSDDRPHRSWRSTMRSFLGYPIHVMTPSGLYIGRLGWVGNDHISLASSHADHEEVTIAWTAVERIFVPDNTLADDPS